MRGKNPHIVQYQGSKRILAPQILQYLPEHFNRFMEPFSGMAAMSIAVAAEGRAERYFINDLNGPVVGILREAVEHPDRLIQAYSEIWHAQFAYGEEHIQHFYEVRERFNQGEQSPANMLYLLARCVKGAVRYGKNGKFNQSPDKRRHGTTPEILSANVYAVSHLLKGKAVFSSFDYRAVLEQAGSGDVVYLDPPYQGVTNTRDHRYLSGVPVDEFAETVKDMNARKIRFLISYDGTCGEKQYGQDLPAELNCKKILLNAGTSTQATLLGKKETTREALYISENLFSLFQEGMA